MKASQEAQFPTSDPALQSPQIITNPGPEYADGVRRYQGIPGIECVPGGRLWATWYSGGLGEGPENYLVLVTRDPATNEWSKPVLVVNPMDPEVRAFDPCLWRDPQNRLWLFWAQSLHDWDGRFGVWAMVSENADQEQPDWSEPRRIGDGIMMNKPTVAKNGDWMLPVSIWIPRKAHHPPHYFDPGEHSGAWVVLSRNAGQTFEYLGVANHQADRIFDEHMLVERRDGVWWMLTRIKSGIWENISTDGGRSWDIGRRSSIPHINSRFFIRRLLSGNLLLVRHTRLADTSDENPEWPARSHLTAFISTDEGETWDGGLLLDERAEVSYPDGTQMPDGTLHIIYDFNRYQEKHILMATFTEADVLARQWISPQSRSRQLINQATAEGRFVPVSKMAQPEPDLG